MTAGVEAPRKSVLIAVQPSRVDSVLQTYGRARCVTARCASTAMLLAAGGDQAHPVRVGVAIIDHRLPMSEDVRGDRSGLWLVAQLAKTAPDIRVIVVGDHFTAHELLVMKDAGVRRVLPFTSVTRVGVIAALCPPQGNIESMIDGGRVAEAGAVRRLVQQPTAVA